jgi:antimicrobial peptide system SdpB family protein
MTELARLLDRLGDTPGHLRGAAAFRVVVGLALLFQLTMLVGHFELTLGRDAIHPFDWFAADFGRTHYSYLALSNHWAWQWIGYGLAIVIVGLWTTGIGGRVGKLGHLLTFLTWWSVHSIHSRCPTLWDGGDNLIEILLLYAIPIDLWNSTARGKPLGRVHTTVHNLAVLACALQIAVMYFTAGLSKVPGKYWQNGTAFYYVLASDEFGLTGLGPLIWDNRVLLALTSWGPLVLQLAFPWIYFFGRPWPRRVAVLLAMTFHTGIFVFMGLNTFALMMIGAELLLLSDADYQAMRLLLGRLPSPRRLVQS